jgi:hypothetical protein
VHAGAPLAGARAPRPPGAAAGGRERLLLAALLFANFALRVALQIRPLEFLDDLAIPDDAYLSLTIARNIARGLGPLYGLEPTNGFQPLYVFFMAPVFAWFPHDPSLPIRVALLLLALFDTAALFFMLRLAARRSTTRLAPLLLGLAWLLHPYAILTALNALETSIAFCFLAALFLALDRLRAAPAALGRPGAPFAIGLLLGVAALARIDGLLAAPVIAGLFLALRRRAGLSLGRIAAATAATVAGALLAMLPWLVYSWHWTHDLLPVSGRALRYLSLSSVDHRPTLAGFYLPMLGRAAGVVVRKHALYLALLVPLAAGLPRLGGSGRELWRRLVGLLPVLAFAVLLFAAYAGVVFGPWHFARYLFPLTLAVLLLFGTLADLWLGALAGRARTALGLALALTVILGSVAQPAFRRLIAPRFEGTWGYRRIGLWARDHFPPGATIGGSQTGALGYFAERLTVVNLDGVVNRGCYDAMRAGRMLDYVRRAGVRDLVWQDDVELLARESRRMRPTAVTRVGRVPGFETWGASWYLYRLEFP